MADFSETDKIEEAMSSVANANVADAQPKPAATVNDAVNATASESSAPVAAHAAQHAKDTYTSDNNGDGKPDVIPPMVRTVAYYLGLVISAVSLVILCIVQAVGAPSWVIPVTLAVDAGYGVIAHGLGAAYNPVKQEGHIY